MASESLLHLTEFLNKILLKSLVLEPAPIEAKNAVAL